VRNGLLANRPADLIRHKILEVIDRYVYACGCGNKAMPQTGSRNAQ